MHIYITNWNINFKHSHEEISLMEENRKDLKIVTKEKYFSMQI